MRKIVILAAAMMVLPALAQAQPSPPSQPSQPSAPTQTQSQSSTTTTTTTTTKKSASGTKKNAPPDWAPAHGYRNRTGATGGDADPPGQSKKKNK